MTNVISTASQIGLEDMGAYGATKWGLLGLTKSLIKEARPYNVRVTALSPGGTDTTFRGEPRPQYLAPETVAAAILFIASLPENAVVHDMVLRPIVETNFQAARGEDYGHGHVEGILDGQRRNGIPGDREDWGRAATRSCSRKESR